MAVRKSILERVAPTRFLAFFAILVVAGGLAIVSMGWSQGVLVGFDVAAVTFMASCAPLFANKPKELREAAERNDANRAVLLLLSFIISVVIFAAIIAELANAEALRPLDKALVAASLVIVWLFGNAVYTLHYAHLFYSRADGGGDAAGLTFPGTKQPVLSDFVYFAYTLGVAVQTADVSVDSPHIRKVVTAHCVAGFFFNLGVLALTINVLSG
jgi:uncharacterized membrane protein